MSNLRKNIRYSLAILFIALVLCCTSQAQTRYRGMGLGLNLSANDLEDFADFGANIARYTLYNPNADDQNSTEYLAWLDSALDAFDPVLTQLKSHNIKVALNLHTPPGGFVTYTTPALHRIFLEAWPQTTIIEAWQKIATRYLDDDGIWGFDILNEPAQKQVTSGLKNWNELAPDIATAIRAIDPNRTIIVQPIYGDQSRLNKLDPLPLSNVIYSIHMYYPLNFIQQGLYRFKKKISYPSGKFNKKSLKKNLKRAIQYQKKNNVDIFIGEFSAVRWAPKNSAYRYLRDLIKVFEKYNWHWSYHSFREFDGWSVEHSTKRKNHNRLSTPTNRGKLLMKYFAKDGAD